MKTYLITTGIIFALLAAMRVLRSVAEWNTLKNDPVPLFAMVGLGLVAAGLSAWAWRLLRRS